MCQLHIRVSQSSSHLNIHNYYYVQTTAASVARVQFSGLKTLKLPLRSLYHTQIFFSMDASGVTYQGAVSIRAAKQPGRHLKRDKLSVTSNTQNNLDLRSQARLRKLAESTINEIGCVPRCVVQRWHVVNESVTILKSSNS